MGILNKLKQWWRGNPETGDAPGAEKLKEKAEDVMEDVNEFADKAASKIGETAEKVWDKVDDYVEPVIEKAGQKAEEVYDKVVDFIQGDKAEQKIEEKEPENPENTNTAENTDVNIPKS